MTFGMDETRRLWARLEKKEQELARDGDRAGDRSTFDSMGRPATALHQLHGNWVIAQMGRVARVRAALRDSGPLAQRMISRTLAGIELATIWASLIEACETIALYCGGAIVTGGIIGGIGGAFFFGIGAVPGAAAGAAAGSYVSGTVMTLLGLKSLVEGLAHTIPEALGFYQQGVMEAWGPVQRDDASGMGAGPGGSTTAAAFHLANGHVLMVAAILTAMVAYLTRGKGAVPCS